MNLQDNTKSWDGVLSKCLKDLKALYPKLNDGQVADRINIPRATFNRIKNEKKLPRLDNLIKVVLGSGNGDSLTDAISFLDTKLSKKLKNVLSVALDEENKLIENSELELLLQNRDVFVAYLLADMPEGTDYFQIAEVLGSSGPSAMKVLLDNGLVKEKEGRLFLLNKGTLVRSFDSIKHHLSTYSRFYRPAHVGKERNYVHSLTDGLNSQGVAKVQLAHKRFHQELQRIYRDEENRGNIPSFSVAFCDTFTSLETNGPQDKGGLQ